MVELELRIELTVGAILTAEVMVVDVRGSWGSWYLVDGYIYLESLSEYVYIYTPSSDFKSIKDKDNVVQDGYNPK